MKLIKILLVEDDQLDIIDMTRTLDRMKIVYNLTVARNGEEAIKVLNDLYLSGVENLPDFVLVDINMPKLNGFEVISQIRKNDKLKHLRCFIITTSEEANDKNQGKLLGVAGYIVKPFKLNNRSSTDSFNLMIDLINA